MSNADIAEGVLAGLAAPLVMSTGLLLWEKYWIGSAVMLNAVKCTIASVFFLALVPFRLHVWRAGLGLSSTNATTSSLNESSSVQQTSLNLTSDASLSMNAEAHVQVARMDMLVLSAFLGIAIGDIVWLHALSVLGARKLILVDSIKPFVGAFFGWMMLGEDIAASGALAIIVTIAGVLIVALEPTPLQYMQHEDVELNHRPASTRTVCQACGTQALANADAHSFCSSCGAPKDKPGIGTQKATILPKATMLPHPPTPSRLVREMSSLLPTSGDMEGYAWAALNIVVDVLGAVIVKQHALPLQAWEINLVRFGSAAVMLDVSLFCITAGYWYLMPRGCIVRMQEPQCTAEGTHRQRAITTPRPRSCTSQVPLWARLPPLLTYEWLFVALGAMLCTFLTPVLSTTALFKLKVATAITLTSTGPIMSLPLSYLIKGEDITYRCIFGSVVACVGVGMFANAT